MSSIEAKGVLNSTELEKALVAKPDMSDSFTALMESILARRKEAVDTKLEDISKFKDGLDKIEEKNKAENLTTLYNNYSAVVKRDFQRAVFILDNLAKLCEDIADITPSSIVKDKDSINPGVLFKKKGRFFSGSEGTLTNAGKAFKEKVLDALKQHDFIRRELTEMRLSRVERINLRKTTQASITTIGKDPMFDAIINSREQLAREEDKFMKRFLKDLKLSQAVAITNQFADSKFKHTESQSQLLLNISKMISEAGTAVTAKMIAERDFLAATTGSKADGALVKQAIRIYNALRTYESKVYGTLHSQPQLDTSRLPALFAAYNARSDAIVPPEYIASKAEQKVFQTTVVSGTKDTREARMLAELTAPSLPPAP